MEPDRPAALLVDDEEGIRDALQRFLERLHYVVHTASDGRSALDVLRRERDIGLVLCDLRMPGMSGDELVPAALAINGDLAIVMLTAVDDSRSAIQCLKHGALDYLLKPVDLAELELAVSRALRRRQLEIERRGFEQWLAREVSQATRSLEEQGVLSQREAVGALTALVDHYERVLATKPSGAQLGRVARAVARELGVTGEDLEEVSAAAHLHAVARITGVRQAFQSFGHYRNTPVFADGSPGPADQTPLGAQIVGSARAFAHGGLPAVEAQPALAPEVVNAVRRVAARGEIGY